VQTEVLTVDTLPSLPALALLNMSNCGLRHVSEGALALLPALQRLDLSANLLAVVPASLVMPCPRLRHLNLARNKLARGPRLRLSLLHDLDISSNALQVPFFLFLPTRHPLRPDSSRDFFLNS
jgi:Leucine-rich repeat (LRR) protein